MLEELIDRFGEPPKSVENLLEIALLKALAHQCYYTEIKETADKIRFTFYFQAKINPANIASVTEKYQGALRFIKDAKAPCFEYGKSYSTRQKNTGALEITERVLQDTQELLVQSFL